MGDKKINCEYTQEITCPYCGYEFLDSCLYARNSGEICCENCERDFKYERTVTVEYSTYSKNE